MRPKISEVFQFLPSSGLDKLQCLYVPGMASHEFQLALGRFYGSTEYKDHVGSSHDPDSKQLVDFLDTVRQPSSLFRPNSCFDSYFRCCGLKDWIKVYSNKRCTTYGEFAVIGP